MAGHHSEAMATTATVVAVAPSDEPAPHKIETGDSIKVKQVLDDSTVEAVRDMGYTPDYKTENLKLLLMFLSCLFAMTAQFYPIPFPASRPLLGVCCASYGLLSLVLQFIITYIDGDTILQTQRADKSEKGEIRVRTSFPRFQEEFILTVQKRSYTSPAPPASSQTNLLNDADTQAAAVKLREQKQGDISAVKMYVGRYFTEAGEFAEARFHADVKAHITRLEKGQAPREYSLLPDSETKKKD